MSLAVRAIVALLLSLVVACGWHVPSALPVSNAATTISVAELRRMAERQEWANLRQLGTRYAEWLKEQEQLAAAGGAAGPAPPAGVNAEALRIFGVAEYQLANLRRAHLFLELAVNASGGLHGAPVDLLHDAGLMALMLRRRAGETYLRRALELDSHHLPSVLSLGSHLVSQGATHEALAIYEVAGGGGDGGVEDDGDADGDGEWAWERDDDEAAARRGRRQAVAQSLAFRVNYALALNFAGRLEEMATVLRRSPDPRARLMAATAVWPIVPRSEAQVDFWRHHAIAAAAEFRAEHDGHGHGRDEQHEDDHHGRGAGAPPATLPAQEVCFEYAEHAQVLRHLDYLDQSQYDSLGRQRQQQQQQQQHQRSDSREPPPLSPPPAMVSAPTAALLASNMGYYTPYHAANNRRLMVAFGQMFRCLAFTVSAPPLLHHHNGTSSTEPALAAMTAAAEARNQKQWSVYADHTNDLRWSAVSASSSSSSSSLHRPMAAVSTGADGSTQQTMSQQRPVIVFFSGHLRNHTLGYLMHHLVEGLFSARVPASVHGCCRWW